MTEPASLDAWKWFGHRTFHDPLSPRGAVEAAEGPPAAFAAALVAAFVATFAAARSRSERAFAAGGAGGW